MSEIIPKNEPASTTLCKACGLCCTGHLFVTADSDSVETKQIQALGLNVLQSDSEKSAFHLPCPLWKGHCTVYTHPHRPSICGDFKCKLLREVEKEQLLLDEALFVVQRTKELIQDLDAKFPAGQAINFRKRLFEYVKQLEQSTSNTETTRAFRLKAGVLLVWFAQRFGVTDLFNKVEQEDLLKERQEND